MVSWSLLTPTEIAGISVKSVITKNKNETGEDSESVISKII